MFISDALIYVELQKTGSTHIANLFSRYLDGEKQGQHNRPTRQQLSSARMFVSSIRNPWEWYLSLWTYGCDGRGGLRERLLESANSPLWKRCYLDARKPELFREWLRRVHGTEFHEDIGEENGGSKILRSFGFYTYRYLKLCCRNFTDLDSDAVRSVNDLHLFDENNCYVSHWIRTESLESDFINVLRESGRQVSRRDEVEIRSSKKTNTSNRKHPTSFYYDDEAIRSVANREALITSKFDYRFPGASRRATP